MRFEDKLKRFDDIYKLLLTLVAITLAFGSRFFEELGVEFFAVIIAAYIFGLTCWSIGHLSDETEFEITLKLLGWGFLTAILPVILVNYLIPREPIEKFPPNIILPCLFLSSILYWSCFRILTQHLKYKFFKRILLTPFILIVAVGILNIISWILK